MDFPSSVELTAIPRANLKKNGSTLSSLASAETPSAPGIVLDHGRPGATTLASEVVGGNRYWKWEWASAPESAARCSFSAEPTQLAAASRPPATTRSEDEPSRDHVLQSMQSFIASLVDTADQSTILAIAQEELRVITSRSAHDPYVGNCIACIPNPAGAGQRSVAYPRGDLGNQLGFLTFESGASETSQASPVPDMSSTAQFATEILQLCYSPTHPPVQHINNSSLLYVRLHSSIRIIRLAPSGTDEVPFQANEIAFASTERFRGRRPMDMTADQDDWGRVLIVDDRGGLWSWQLSVSAFGLEEDLRCIKEANEPHDEYYRVAYGAQMDTAICASSSKLELHELKNSSIPSSVVHAATRSAPIIALEATSFVRGSLWTCVCTAEALIWLDERRPKQPVLSWIHSRGPDPAMTVTACDTGGEACRYILWSRNSLLITVYTISKTSPARSLCDPYLLATPRLYHGFAIHSISALPYPDGSIDLLVLATDGSLYSFPVKTHPAGSQHEFKHANAEQPIQHQSQSPSNKETKRSQSVNFMRAWRDINADVTAPMSAERPRMEELIAKWGPVISGTDMLAAKVKLDDAPRSDFLLTTQTAEDDMGELFSELRETATLRLDNSEAIKYILGLDTKNDHLQNLFGKVFSDDREATDAEKERQTTAVRLLARDLRLAGEVYSMREPKVESKPALAAPASPEDLFARVAEALTLQEAGPPPVTFSFLEPKDTASLSNATVRGLMSEWSLGDDPSKFIWSAPNKVSTPVPGSPALERPTRAMPQSSPFGRPRSPMPQTQPSFSLGRSDNLGGLRSTLWPREHASLGRPAVVLSSPTRSNSQSQDLPGAQTQVLPGPFGGRTAAKKKPKKRVAGF